MDSSDGHLLWPILYVCFLICDFILAAYLTAMEDTAQKEQTERIRSAAWFWLILTAVPAGVWVSGFAWPALAAMICALAALTYVAAVSLPVLFGMKYEKQLLKYFETPVGFLSLIVWPVTRTLTLCTYGAGRLFGIRARDLEDEVTEDEIISMVNEGHEQGVLDEHEAEMIQNIFQLDDKEARNIMTHRKNILAVSSDMNLTEAISFMVNAPNSRFPVYEENIDNITGVLHFKDAVIYHDKGGYDDWRITDIPKLIRPIVFIPETRGIDTLFRSMQAQKMHMAIVVDEYGETAGLVTMEDILEEIVGNILDEYDEDEHNILPQEDGSYLMAGMTPIGEVEETLGISFEEEDYDTLNGYLVYRLDRIPHEDEHSVITFGDWSFTITQVESKTIRWVQVRKNVPDETAGEGSPE